MRIPLAILTSAALALGACSRSGADTQDGSQTALRGESQGPLKAVFSCHAGGAPFPVSACIVGSKSTGNISGSVEIRSGGEVRRYSDYDVMGEFSDSETEISLHEPFSIRIQANGDRSLILRLEIRQGRNTIFSDEAAEYEVIRFDSDDADRIANKRLAGDSRQAEQ